MDKQARFRFVPHIVLGASLIAAGMLVLLDNLDILHIGPIWGLWRLWPLILVVIGLAKFWESSNMKQRRHGFWLITIGVWLLISFFEVFGLGFGETWPLLLIAAGISSVWQATSNEPHRISQQGE